MYFFSSFIVAVSTALIAPGISTTISAEAEPIPLRPAAILEQPTPPPETKPLPSTAPTVKVSACNCYNILKENFKSVPPMQDIIKSATSSGNVAVFKYPATPDWPTGIPHVALVRNVLPDGSIQIEEYNYHRCTHSFRTITPDDHRLVGFVTL